MIRYEIKRGGAFRAVKLFLGRLVIDVQWWPK